MAGETIITVVGNLTADPELRFTPGGHPVANFTIASTPRVWDRQANEFRDGDPLFMRCAAWREQAENIAETLTKGSRVIAQGRLVQRSWENQAGERRTAVELQIDEIGPALRYATAAVQKRAPNTTGARTQAPAGLDYDPWATPAEQGATDDPPF